MNPLTPESLHQQRPLRSIWGPVTIRVTWTLYQAGLEPKDLLTSAREHVLLSIPDKIHPNQAEELAEHFTKEFIQRFLHNNYRTQDMETCGIEPQYRWRQDLIKTLDGLAEVVFHLGYGDRLSLDQISETTGTDTGILTGSQEGIRAAIRSILHAEGVGLAQAEPRALDLLLHRLALMAAPECSGGEEILRSDKRSHVERCPRCARGLRLIRANKLSPSDLMPPTDNWTPPRTSVLALHLHPDARQKRSHLIEAFRNQVLQADDDLLMLDPDHIPNYPEILWDMTQISRPAKDHLRGSIARGGGRWTESALIGPVAQVAMEKTRSQVWGQVDGVDSLPDPIPEPPSPARWWFTALGVTLLALLIGVLALRGPGRKATFPLSAEFRIQPEQKIVSARFDADDEAYIAVISQGLRGLRVEHLSNESTEKGVLGTGSGDYLIHVEGQGATARLLLVSSPHVLGELQELLSLSSGALAPLDELAQLLENRYPQADIKIQPALY